MTIPLYWTLFSTSCIIDNNSNASSSKRKEEDWKIRNTVVEAIKTNQQLLIAEQANFDNNSTHRNVNTLPTNVIPPGAPQPLIDDVDSVEFAIGILSGRDNVAKRNRIRNTWKNALAAQGNKLPYRTLPVFFVGSGYCEIPVEARTNWYQCLLSPDWENNSRAGSTAGKRTWSDFRNSNTSGSGNLTARQQQQIELDHIQREDQLTQQLYQEALLHGDIVLLNVQDFYQNSPLKVATYLAWVVRTFRNAQYVMKMDDDVFLDWRLFFQKMQVAVERRSSEPDRFFWWGNTRLDFPIFRPDINKGPAGRWAVSRKAWRSEHWPVYMSGVGSVMDIGAAKFIVQNYDTLNHDMVSEDIALGVWLVSTNVQYIHGDTFSRYPTIGCDDQSLIFYSACKLLIRDRRYESEIQNNNHNNSTCGIHYYYRPMGNYEIYPNPILKWQRSMGRSTISKVKLIEWNVDNKEGRIEQPYKKKWKQQLKEINDFISLGYLKVETTGRVNWLSIEQQHHTPGLRYMMPQLRKWKERLESQGCQLVLTTVLRDPYQRIMSLLKHDNILRSGYVVDAAAMDQYFSARHYDIQGQARFLLYNSCEKHTKANIHPKWCDITRRMGNNTLSQEEIDELLGYLKEFDIVGRTDRIKQFNQQTAALTGWPFLEDIIDEDIAEQQTVPEFNLTQYIKTKISKVIESDKLLWDSLFLGS